MRFTKNVQLALATIGMLLVMLTGMVVPAEAQTPTKPLAISYMIDDVSSNGKIITLMNGTVWEVHFLDQIRTMLWLPCSRVEAYRSNDPSYPILFLHTTKEQTARVKQLR